MLPKLWRFGLAAVASIGLTAAAFDGQALQRRDGTPSSEGFHDGYYYYWWTDGGANATYINGALGNFEYVTFSTRAKPT